jgi:hypothetical protein
MFDLEKSIANWRTQMLAARIKTPVPLEELEIHLREEIEQQLNSGLNKQDAFAISVRQIGDPKILEREFKKSKRNIMKKRLIIGIGIFVLFLGVTMILPALGKHKQRNYVAFSTGANYFSLPWAPDEKYGLALGTAFVVCGAGTTIFSFKRRKA